MKTIITKYLSPTATQGSRVKAIGGGQSVIIQYDHSMTEEALHGSAVMLLNKKLGWSGKLISGHTDTGMIWVFDNGYTIKIGGEIL